MMNFIQRRLGTRSGAQSMTRRILSNWAARVSLLRVPGGSRGFLAVLCLIGSLLAALPAHAANSLNWETKQNRVSADIKGGKLLPLLEQVASITGWQVFLEPDTTCTVSAKFDRLPPGEALHLLLHDLN